MHQILMILPLFFLSFFLTAQTTTEFEGQVRVTDMVNDSTSNSLVVLQSDGTLAQRSASHITPNLSVSLIGDTLFQSDNNWIIIPGISDANKVRYRVTFNALWSVGSHPVDFPSSAHFSRLIGMTHDPSISLFTIGELASPGIKSMAETGSISTLTPEIVSYISSKKAQSLISGSGIGVSPGSVSIEFDINQSHHLVSLVSMIAPSPDWFIGVKDIRLFENGSWVSTKTTQINVYDSGTDSGESFTSFNQATDPFVPVFMITTPPLGSNGIVPSMGTMTFERIDNQ